MITINVLLAGRLHSYLREGEVSIAPDGTYQISVSPRSTVSDVIALMRLPEEDVALIARNGRACGIGERLDPGDRIVLVHPNVAGMWRMLQTWNKGMESNFDFGEDTRGSTSKAAA